MMKVTRGPWEGTTVNQGVIYKNTTVDSVWWPSPSRIQKPAPLSSPSPRSSPTSELPRRSRGGGGGEREASQWSLLLLRGPPCRKHAAALFISPAGDAGAGAGILLHCAGELASGNSLLSQSPSSVFFSLRARLRLRRARSMPVLGFRSVLSAALTGCDPKGGCLARDLGRFAPLCVHPG